MGNGHCKDWNHGDCQCGQCKKWEKEKVEGKRVVVGLWERALSPMASSGDAEEVIDSCEGPNPPLRKLRDFFHWAVVIQVFDSDQQYCFELDAFHSKGLILRNRILGGRHIVDRSGGSHWWKVNNKPDRKIFETTDFDGVVHRARELSRQWVRDHPNYYLIENNCQDYAKFILISLMREYALYHP